MEIKILGTGCPKCKRLEQLAHAALEESGIAAATITKVTDINAITAYPIMSTPALVVNEQVVCSGRLPRKEEIIAWLRQAAQV
jgi:small redox-active disulfide protein 2